MSDASPASTNGLRPSLRAGVDAAVQAAGGNSKLARSLGLTRAAPRHWSRVPDKHVRKVAAITGLPLHQLRPDLYGGITGGSGPEASSD